MTCAIVLLVSESRSRERVEMLSVGDVFTSTKSGFRGNVVEIDEKAPVGFIRVRLISVDDETVAKWSMAPVDAIGE